MKRRHVFVSLIALTLLALAVAGCGGSPQSETDTAEQTDPGEANDAQSSEDEDERAGSEGDDEAAPEPTARSQSDAEDEERVSNPHPDSWMDMPVIPVVTDTAREIYARGQQMGRDPHSFSIVGDCQNVSSHFLGDFHDPEAYSLGSDYAYLQTTIDYFEPSFSAKRAAVRGGYNVASVLSPLWTNLALCEYGTTPLGCEYELNNPSIVLISMETNFDQKSAEEWADYLRQIVEFSMDEGVVPILTTKADNMEGDHSINQAIVQVAWEYDVPLWNFWASVQHLEDGGLTDGFHLSYARPFFDDPARMQYAWPIRNLTALQSLDAVWRGASEDAPPYPDGVEPEFVVARAGES